jgi:Fe-S-cluster-containing hydrogenase component 2
MAIGRIVIDEERCKGCALCTAACPKGLITVRVTTRQRLLTGKSAGAVPCVL